MTWEPTQRTDHAIVRYEGRPNEGDAPVEKTRWRRFLEFFHLVSRKSSDLGEAYAGAEIAKRQNEATKIGAEAAEIAAKADLTRTENVTLVNAEIRRIFTDEQLPPEVKAMQLNALAKEHPEILEQLKVIDELTEKLRINKGVQIQVIEDRTPSPNP